ncbi:MAG: aquaporin [archaeon]|nr:aquaporin [archaeon]
MWKNVGAEFFGTAFMVGVGCGTIALGWSGLAVSFSFGFAVFLAIVTCGPISGAHINPAVTLGFWRSGHLEGKLVIPYIIAQIFGGLLGAGLTKGAGPTLPRDDISLAELVGIEVFITSVLMASILFILLRTTSTTVIAAWVGGSVALLAFVFGPLTGASMNPARTVGPNLVSNHASIIVTYVVSCCFGAMIASEIARRTTKNKPNES